MQRSNGACVTLERREWSYEDVLKSSADRMLKTNKFNAMTAALADGFMESF